MNRKIIYSLYRGASLKCIQYFYKIVELEMPEVCNKDNDVSIPVVEEVKPGGVSFEVQSVS